MSIHSHRVHTARAGSTAVPVQSKQIYGPLARKDELIAICDALGNLGKEQSFYHISHYMDQVSAPDVFDTMQKAMAKIRQHHT